MALNYGFIWGQPEALVASTLFGGVRHAAAHLLLLLLMGQAMLAILFFLPQIASFDATLIVRVHQPEFDIP